MSEEFLINCLRCLSSALPYQAKSGHPGAAMGCAPIVYSLFVKHMMYSTSTPNWIGRDMFVLSNGHGCALLYSILHLTGYDISLSDLKNFRKIHSKTPGHPESFQTPGVDVTTGPLGQGIAQAVGLAIASEYCRERYNRCGFELFRNFVYCIVGDGCLQEGISSEASSLAGHLKLSRLIVFYDKNGISIDGSTDLSFTENVKERYLAYGWLVLEVTDADKDFGTINDCINKAKANGKKPTLIICNTTIGYGSCNQGSEQVHGAPLSLDDMKAIRTKWGLSSDDFFHLPDEAINFYKNVGKDKNTEFDAWNNMFVEYTKSFPDEAKEIELLSSCNISSGWETPLQNYKHDGSSRSTRYLSGIVLNLLAERIPFIMGGSADLTVSNVSSIKSSNDFTDSDRSSRYIRFGVREHAMAAICNGMASFGGIRPFAATFLNFYTYAWGAVRISALSQLGVLYIATHDSIELGEDGPTHQPIEVSALCRATPNLNYIRPADMNEVIGAYMSWISNKNTPTILGLCRNAVPPVEGTSKDKVSLGAYIIKDFKMNQKDKLILGSCGSELHMCYDACIQLENEFDVRLLSVPSWNIFERQSLEYKTSIIPKNIKSLYVEACNTLGAEKYFTESLGMTTFGNSAPREQLWNEFGFTSSNIQLKARSLFASNLGGH